MYIARFIESVGVQAMKRTEIKRRPLSDTVLATLEPESKEYRELDGNGLYFRVKPDGNKSWQLRYKKADGKRSWLGIGTYPDLSGAGARKKREKLSRIFHTAIIQSLPNKNASDRILNDLFSTH